LLDEVTVDLDVVARLDLLDFFKEECDQVFTCYISIITFRCMHTLDFEAWKYLKRRH
jgi:ABC-type uncharacterized transport system ATPase subunit